MNSVRQKLTFSLSRNEIDDFKILKSKFLEIFVILKNRNLEIQVDESGISLEKLEFEEISAEEFNADAGSVADGIADSHPAPRHKLFFHEYSPDTIFVVLERQVYQIQINLVNTLNNSDAEQLEKIDLFAEPITLVKELVRSDQAIQSFSLNYDLLTGFKFALKTNDFNCEEEISPIFTFPKPQYDESAVENPDQFDYSKLSTVPLQLTKPPSTKGTYPDFITQENFKQITSQISRMRVDIQTLLDNYALLQSRLKTLVSQQKQPSITIPAPISRTERLNAIHERHTTLKSRVVKILELLYDLSQPHLTAAEIKWFGELQNLYLKYVEEYQPKLDKLRSVRRGEKVVYGEMLGMKQVREIREMLAQESREMRKLGDRVASLGLRIEKIEKEL